MSYLCTYYFNS